MAEQLFQIGIKGLVKNSKGEFLLIGRRGDGGYQSHKDFPGGRMEPSESFLDALKRELQEEIGLTYVGTPEFITVLLSNITIPVGEDRVPLVLMIYKIQLPESAEIILGDGEEEYEWLNSAEAAKRLQYKYPQEFCEQIVKL